MFVKSDMTPLTRQALASEVVALEERLRAVRSDELRAGRRAEEAEEAAGKSARRAASAEAERANLAAMLAALQVYFSSRDHMLSRDTTLA